MTTLESPPPPSNDAKSASADCYARGLAQMRLCDVPGYQEAVVLFVEARALAPDSAAVYAALAETCVHWGWRREIVGLSCRGHYEDAHAHACRALELAPESSDVHRAMAAALRLGRKRDRALRLAEARRAWEINPYNGDNCLELWRSRGRDIDDPLAEQAVALDPASVAAHIDLGVASTEAGRHQEAAYHLGRALELNPDNSLALYDLAMVLLREGRPGDARDRIEAALRANPGEPLLRRGLEIVLREMGEAPS